MASSVTSPLERNFGQIPGLQQMTSTSSFGCSVITLQFVLDLNIDVAEQEVQAEINSASQLLPKDLPNPPIYSKINPADAPILTLALTSDTLAAGKGRGSGGYHAGAEDFATFRGWTGEHQRRAAARRAGAGEPDGAGFVRTEPGGSANRARAMRTWTRPRARSMAQHQAFTIGANDQLLSSSGYNPIIIAYRNGAPVRVSDVAVATDGAENVRQAAWANKRPAVILNIQRQPGANIISVVDRVKKILPQLQAALPGSVHVEILTDRTTTIRASVDDVKFTLLLTIALVVMVIFLVLAQRASDDYSEFCRAAVDRGHVWSDVSAGILVEQSFADGADDFHGIRRGRRHRDDREHQPVHRAG